ncbi:hypothetical protein [Thauera sinica]|uniref:Uncharacterized protein n=1 Tax=Thauera sinica TaxID=2665146 RepID=A0ABW1AMV4_9RHOO|nr:hypothetical protein [Thauera sp. K11]ATE61636.1 hypothetical protein CCZ27_18205 [Thauera sp. K11]
MTDQVDLQDFLVDVGKSVALGMLPFLGQAIDIYDTAYAAYDLYQNKDGSAEQREEACFGVVMAAVGWIPGPGDGIKKTLKTINRDPERYAPLLLDAVRYVLYQAGYKVDPYAFLMESIDAERIRSLIEGARSDIAKSEFFSHCPALVQEGMLRGLNLTMANIPVIVGVVERRVKRWLKVVPKNTAAVTRQTAHPAPKQPPGQQQGRREGEVGTHGQAHGVSAFNGTANAAEIATANLNQRQESIGEHVGDYHCQDELGWGRQTAQHDIGTGSAKLTDGARLMRLQHQIKARGRGIDAIWRTGRARPYAVVEYKTRSVPLSESGIRSLLIAESAQDKSLQPAKRAEQREYRKQVKGGNARAVPPAPLPNDVPKMSHKWIRQRVERHKGLSPSMQKILGNPNKYSRHVIQVSTASGAGKVHREELDLALEEKREVSAAEHTAHQTDIDNFTNVFTEAPEDKPQDRAGKKGTTSMNQQKSKARK